MKAFVFDTETTGLVGNPLIPLESQPEIIEFVGILVDDAGAMIEDLEFLCAPKRLPLDFIITKITGIKDEDVRGKPAFGTYADRVASIISRADVIVAHNLSFDMQMLNYEFARLQREIVFPARKVCTVESTEHIKGHRLTLSNLHENLFGSKFEGAHRARADVEALVKCYIKMRDQKVV